MNRQEFITELRTKLCGFPEKEIRERIDFYVEMIDDRIEDGLSEEEAVSQIGSVEDIAAQVIADIPFSKIAKEKIKSRRRLKAWEIVLISLGSPIWLSLAIAAFSVMISLYAVIWSAIIFVWAVFASLVACAIGGVLAGIAFAVIGNEFSGIAIICAGIVSAGVAIFFFFGCKATTKGVLLLTKKIVLGIKMSFIKKEEAK